MKDRKQPIEKHEGQETSRGEACRTRNIRGRTVKYRNQNGKTKAGQDFCGKCQTRTDKSTEVPISGFHKEVNTDSNSETFAFTEDISGGKPPEAATELSKLLK
jgi:hypothetical protein